MNEEGIVDISQMDIKKLCELLEEYVRPAASTFNVLDILKVEYLCYSNKNTYYKIHFKYLYGSEIGDDGSYINPPRKSDYNFGPGDIKCKPYDYIHSFFKMDKRNSKINQICSK